MMSLFVIGIVILVIIIVVCVILLLRLSRQETLFMEVSDRYLTEIGKDYTRNEFAMTIFELYRDVIEAVQKENYEFLRDVLSNEIYNNYLLGIKVSKERQIKNVVEDMKPVFARLVQFVQKDSTEVAKVWLRVSYIEYALDLTPLTEEQQKVAPKERIAGGSKTKREEKEYLLTLVKSHTPKESMVCPSCGYILKVITRCHCVRCGTNIVTRPFHWVITSKEDKALSQPERK